MLHESQKMYPDWDNDPLDHFTCELCDTYMHVNNMPELDELPKCLKDENICAYCFGAYEFDGCMDCDQDDCECRVCDYGVDCDECKHRKCEVEGEKWPI